ncbi:hypothetical protein NL108_004104 [Boleophthalmus pectinirostris]|nr:hypothetical protein NL108_004104 [Boleophthalmus pectinirostris]
MVRGEDALRKGIDLDNGQVGGEDAAVARARRSEGRRIGGKEGISSAPLCDWKFNRGTGRDRATEEGGGGERERRRGKKAQRPHCCAALKKKKTSGGEQCSLQHPRSGREGGRG